MYTTARYIKLLVVTVTTFTSVSSTAFAQPKVYEVIAKLDGLDSTQFQQPAVNDKGEVAGSCTSPDKVCLWRRGKTTQLPLPTTFKNPSVKGMNNKGTIIGDVRIDNFYTGYKLTSDGELYTLPAAISEQMRANVKAIAPDVDNYAGFVTNLSYQDFPAVGTGNTWGIISGSAYSYAYASAITNDGLVLINKYGGSVIYNINTGTAIKGVTSTWAQLSEGSFLLEPNANQSGVAVVSPDIISNPTLSFTLPIPAGVSNCQPNQLIDSNKNIYQTCSVSGGGQNSGPFLRYPIDALAGQYGTVNFRDLIKDSYSKSSPTEIKAMFVVNVSSTGNYIVASYMDQNYNSSFYLLKRTVKDYIPNASVD